MSVITPNELYKKYGRDFYKLLNKNTIHHGFKEQFIHQGIPHSLVNVYE